MKKKNLVYCSVKNSLNKRGIAFFKMDNIWTRWWEWMNLPLTSRSTKTLSQAHWSNCGSVLGIGIFWRKKSLNEVLDIVTYWYLLKSVVVSKFCSGYHLLPNFHFLRTLINQKSDFLSCTTTLNWPVWPIVGYDVESALSFSRWDVPSFWKRKNVCVWCPVPLQAIW